MPAPLQVRDQAEGTRTVRVNGETVKVHAETVAALLHELEWSGEWLGTAVNGDLVPRTERAHHPIREGDRIEVLSPMQGG